MSAIELFEKYKIEINSMTSIASNLISRNCRFWFSSGTFHGLSKLERPSRKTGDDSKRNLFNY
ncbi:MAG: hypothetical protein IPM97_08205 [Bdellovibrionaceae bacterium]|nr:hypothetical protein [Pseudobdellovibrionaceae bacterium]